MRAQNLLMLGALLTASFYACQQNPPAPPKSVMLGSAGLQQSRGLDCDKPDSLRTNCAVLDLHWPEVKEGPAGLKKAVADWTTGYIGGILAPETSSNASISIDSAARAFFLSHQAMSKEAPDSPLGHWTAESHDTVLLNDGVHLTLKIDGFLYTGGAHGLPLASIASFDIATGKQLGWADLVQDTVQLQKIAEQQFRQEREDLFKPEAEGGADFKFDDVFVFKLPDNFGLTDKGIYCCYVPYEVTPYVFGPTEFVIPFEALGGLLKHQK